MSSSRFSDFIGRIKQDKETAEKLKRDLDNLSAQSNVFEQYFYTLCNPKKLQEEFRSVSHDIGRLQQEAKQVAAKANEKLQIAFIGHTSAGKTTLINALLGEEILIAHCLATTLCNVAISGTNEKEWSATVQGTNQKLEEKSLKEMLHQFSKNRKSFMAKYKLTAASVIELKWPFEKCKALADHVILYDTPGLGELRDGDDVDGAVTELLRSMDVVVAAMDIHSPGLKTVQTVIKGANCNYTLAAFTKWDKYINRPKADDQVDVVSNGELMDDYTKMFQGSVDSTGEVFFVDAKSHFHERKTEGATNFRSFESHLVEAANGKLKSELIHNNLLLVTDKSITAASLLGGVIEDKRAQEMERIVKELRRVQALDRMLDDILNEEKEKLLQSLEKVDIKDVTNCIGEHMLGGLFDKDIVQNCLKKLNQLAKESFSQCGKTIERRISKCVKEINPNADADSYRIDTPSPWEPIDFEIDDSYKYSVFKDCVLYLVIPASVGGAGAAGAAVAAGGAEAAGAAVVAGAAGAAEAVGAAGAAVAAGVAGVVGKAGAAVAAGAAGAAEAVGAAVAAGAAGAIGTIAVVGTGVGAAVAGVATGVVFSIKKWKRSTKRRECLEEFIKCKYFSLREKKYQDAVTSCLEEVKNRAKGNSFCLQKSINEAVEHLNDPDHILNKSYQEVRRVLESMQSLVCE